jgi:hypothetical protein
VKKEVFSVGIFDKLVKKATEVAETYTQKAQGAITGSQADMYILQPQDMRGVFPLDTNGEAEQEPWELIKGTAKVFTIADKTLEIPSNLDAFNTYRLRFRELAIKCAEKVEAEYKAKVHDFITFAELYPKIYCTHLNPLIKRAIDALIAENVLTVTYESFLVQHKKEFNFAIDDYETIVNSVELTVEANKQVSSELASMASGFFDKHVGKLGLGEMASQLVTSVKDNAVDNASDNCKGITSEQQIELYQRIDVPILMSRLYTDYYNVCLSLMWTLRKNGHDIWWFPEESNEQANIFQNLSNPNFPKDKVVDVLIGLLKTDPINIEYYKFMVAHFGETEEVKTVTSYFGYTDFNNQMLT